MDYGLLSSQIVEEILVVLPAALALAGFMLAYYLGMKFFRRCCYSGTGGRR